MSNWEAIADKHRKTAEEVSESEKDKWQLLDDRYNKIAAQKKIKQSALSYEDMSWGKTILSSIENLPADVIPFATEYVTGIYEAVRHPVLTAKGLGSVVSGAVKVGGTKSGRFPAPRERSEPDKSDDVIQWLNIEKELYNHFGTEANFKKTIAENPMEVLTTVAELFIPAGKLAKLPKLTKVGRVLEPVNLVAKGLSPLLKPFKNLPASLHTRALKLADTIPKARRDKLVDISQKNKLVMTFKSADKLQAQIDNLEEVKDFMIRTSGLDTKLPVNDLFKGLDSYTKTMLETSSEGIKVKAIVEDIKKSILKAEAELKRKDLTALQVNERKVRFNKELYGFYDKLGAVSEALPFKQEIKAVINKTMKEYLEEIIPEVGILSFDKISRKILKKEYGVNVSLKQLNEIDGALITLRKAIRAEAYKASIGEFMNFKVGQKAATGTYAGALTGGGAGALFGDPIQGAKIGGLIGGGGGLVIGMIDSSPKIKMATGNFLNTLKGAGITVTPTAAMIRMGLYESQKMVQVKDN